MNDYRYGFFDRLSSAVRQSPVNRIKACLRLAEQHQIPITASELEAHHLAGGRIMDLMEALVYAKEHNLDLSIRRARVQDLVHGREHTVKDWLVDCRRRGVTDFEREPFS